MDFPEIGVHNPAMNIALLKGRPCILFMILFSVIATAQVASTELHDGGSSAAVSLPFFVDDRQGNPVLGLAQPELSILDNRKPLQSVAEIRPARQLPLRIGLIIDVSNSEKLSPTHGLAVKALAEFLNHMLTSPKDKAFVVTFAEVPQASAFMGRNEFLASKFNVSLGGETALFDAISLACNERMRTDPTQPSRRVLVILSDGHDNHSKVSENKAIAAAQASGTVIFAVNDGGPYLDKGIYGEDLGARNLEEIADDTGGRFFNLQYEDAAKALTNIKRQIDNMYSVTFFPAEPGNNGKFHSVGLKSSADPKLRIRAPKGYYVSSGDSKR
jgi:VWFA-related protein